MASTARPEKTFDWAPIVRLRSFVPYKREKTLLPPAASRRCEVAYVLPGQGIVQERAL